MPSDFFVFNKIIGCNEVLIGFLPTDEELIETHYLTITSLEVDWWGRQDPSPQIEYGTALVSSKWYWIKHSIESSGRPIMFHDPTQPFSISQHTPLFNVIFYPKNELITTSLGNDMETCGTFQRNWFFNDEVAPIQVTAHEWLYFLYRGVASHVAANVKVQGRQTPFQPNAPKPTKFPKRRKK